MIQFKLLNIRTCAAASRVMPRAKYYGFALGADTHHPDLLIELAGQSHYVAMGAPLVLETPFDGQPVVTPLRRIWHQVEDAYEPGDPFVAYQSRVHVLGLTCPQELAIAVPQKMRTIVHSFTPTGNGTGVAVLVVPFAGRSRAHFSVDGDAGNVEVWGGLSTAGTDLVGDLDPDTDMNAAIKYYQVVATTAQAAGTADFIVEDLDTYDVLELRLGDGGDAFANTVIYRVVG